MPIVFVIYWILGKNVKNQNLFLLAASYFFYAWWNWRYLSLVLLCSLVNFFAGMLMKPVIPMGNDGSEKRRNTLILSLCCIVCLGILSVFKYYDFFVTSFVDAFSIFGVKMQAHTLNLILPVGISFYTFHTLSYTIDVYRGKFAPTKDIISFFLFVSIFPLAMAGPIERATNLLPQIYTKRTFNYDRVREGMKLVLWGLFMKVVVADRVCLYVDKVYINATRESGLSLTVATFLFAVQIYCDFAGYSNMAIGIGKILGFNFLQNFNRPYFSTGITQFWRRWHISLSSWLRDYIYMALGGSHCSKWRNYWNIFVVFLISGLWHGANWTFIVWGILHGVFQIIERIFGLQKSDSKGFVKIFRILITFLIVNLLWVFFRAPTISEAWYVISKIFTDLGNTNLYLATNTIMLTIVFGVSMLFGKEIFDEFFPNRMRLFDNPKIYVRWAAYILIFVSIMLVGVFDGGQFIYFQF